MKPWSGLADLQAISETTPSRDQEMGHKENVKTHDTGVHGPRNDECHSAPSEAATKSMPAVVQGV